MISWIREKYLGYLGRKIAALDRKVVSDSERYAHMNRLGKLRYKYDQILNKQLKARADRGIKEIESRVDWL